ncbi:MAG: hypothetical protein AAGG53_12990 [Cyanobacteria bacterium P01_H01_bin.152]
MIPNPTAHAVDDTDRQKIDESAFPLADHGEFLSRGLTKREWFAAMVLQGIVSNNHMYSDQPYDVRDIARSAVSHADALLNELNRSDIAGDSQ